MPGTEDGEDDLVVGRALAWLQHGVDKHRLGTAVRASKVEGYLFEGTAQEQGRRELRLEEDRSASRQKVPEVSPGEQRRLNAENPAGFAVRQPDVAIDGQYEKAAWDRVERAAEARGVPRAFTIV